MFAVRTGIEPVIQQHFQLKVTACVYQFRHLTISTRPLLGGLVSQITGQRYWGESLHYSKVRGSAKHTIKIELTKCHTA